MNPEILTLRDFEYNLPAEKIAQKPLDQRDSSRIFIRKSDGGCIHQKFSSIADHIPNDSIIIVNDSKVFASRLIGKLETGGKIEIFVLESPQELQSSNGKNSKVTALGRPLKKLKEDTKIYFENSVIGTVIKKETDGVNGQVTVTFDIPPVQLMEWMNESGYVPLPPYIHREDAKPARESADRETYQTVYAKEQGSVAAPTAGLHFNEKIIAELANRNIKIYPVTLHVGAGTFMPVKLQDIDQHKMHREVYKIPKQTCEAIVLAREEGRKIIAVGTTSFRSIESALKMASESGTKMEAIANTWLSTELFVRPKTKDDRFSSTIIDGLITNFHQPGSTLFMLICSLIGYQNAINHYEIAVEKNYRFLSYGDSNLLWL